MNSILHYLQSKKTIPYVVYVSLFHFVFLAFLYTYSPTTKPIQNKSSIKENFTVLPTNSYTTTSFSKPMKLPKKNLENISSSQKTSPPASSKTTSLNTRTHTNHDTALRQTKNNESKNKIKKLSETILAQMNSLEASSEEMHSLYQSTSDYNAKISPEILSSSQIHHSFLENGIIALLENSLSLPDPEDVILLLSLSPKGLILSIEIEKSNSLKNSEYCIKEIKNLSFHNLIEKNKVTQTVTFRIKLRH